MPAIAPAARKQAIVAAMVAAGGQDIGGLGVAFLFNSHDSLQVAKRNLGNPNYPGEVYIEFSSWFMFYCCTYDSSQGMWLGHSPVEWGTCSKSMHCWQPGFHLILSFHFPFLVFRRIWLRSTVMRLADWPMTLSTSFSITKYSVQPFSRCT